MGNTFLAPCIDGFKEHDFVSTYMCHRCKKSWKQLWEEHVERVTDNRKAVFTLQTRPKREIT